MSPAVKACRSTPVATLVLGVVALGCTGTIAPSATSANSRDGTNDGPAPGGNGGAAQNPHAPKDDTAEDSLADPRACSVVTPLPRRIRALNSRQYLRTVAAVLGGTGAAVEPYPASDRAGEFATGADLRRFDFRATHTLVGNAAQVGADAVTNLKMRFTCLAGAAPSPDCVDNFVRALGRELYRAPVDDAHAGKLAKLFSSAREKAGVDAAVALTVRAMLSSPRFLFRTELGEPTGDGDHRLTAHETAAALAYTLTDAPPDADLRAAAESGALQSAVGVRQQADRLLKQAIASADDGPSAFLRELFRGRDFLGLQKDPKTFPGFDEKTRGAVLADFDATLSAMLQSGSPTLRTLLTSKQMVVRPETVALLRWDGVGPIAAGGQLLAAPEAQRVGILTHPVLMALHAHESDSNPVARGHFVSDKLLCVQVPAPPDVVVFPDRGNQDGKTLRQIIEQVHSVQGCAGCHALMDPFGFPFEIFDAVGRLRDTDRGLPIDATGAIKATGEIDGPVADARTMVERIAGSNTAHACFTQRAFKYIAGEVDDESLFCRSAGFARAFIDGGGNIPDLFSDVVVSDLFLRRR